MSSVTHESRSSTETASTCDSETSAPTVCDTEQYDSFAGLKIIPDDLPTKEGGIEVEEGVKATGGFADVYRGRYRGQLVAIKAIRHIENATTSTVDTKFERETRLWWLLEHENVLPLLGFMESPHISPYKLMVSPWCENGNLVNFLAKHPNISMMQRLDLFRGIAEGLNYLHTPIKPRTSVVIHGDLKPANILISNDWKPKIADFGLVRIIHDGPPSGYTSTSSYFATIRYLAPDIFQEDVIKPRWMFWESSEHTSDMGRPTTFSDIYALGIIGMEIMTSIKPYPHIHGDTPASHCKLLNEIQAGHPPAKRPHGTHGIMKEMWKQLFEASWRLKPKKRPTAKEICALLDASRRHPGLPGRTTGMLSSMGITSACADWHQSLIDLTPWGLKGMVPVSRQFSNPVQPAHRT